jgi:hypothetical protein
VARLPPGGVDQGKCVCARVQVCVCVSVCALNPLYISIVYIHRIYLIYPLNPFYPSYPSHPSIVSIY